MADENLEAAEALGLPMTAEAGDEIQALAESWARAFGIVYDTMKRAGVEKDSCQYFAQQIINDMMATRRMEWQHKNGLLKPVQHNAAGMVESETESMVFTGFGHG